jgi:hypothetical protein
MPAPAHAAFVSIDRDKPSNGLRSKCLIKRVLRLAHADEVGLRGGDRQGECVHDLFYHGCGKKASGISITMARAFSS